MRLIISCDRFDIVMKPDYVIFDNDATICCF